MHDVSSWDLPLSDESRVEIIKKASGPFQNKDGSLRMHIREHANAKEVMRQLTEDLFLRLCKMDPKY